MICMEGPERRGPPRYPGRGGRATAAGGDRARIGALGARLGAGAELCLDNGLSFGLRGLVVLHRTQEAGEGVTTVSTLVFFEPALTVDLGF